MEASVEKKRKQRNNTNHYTYFQRVLLIHVRESIHYFAHIELDHH